MNLDPTTEITFNDLTSSIRSAIEFSMKTCTLFGFTQLNESLKRLPMLLVEDSLEQWIDFTKQLRSIARNNRLIGEEWKLSREQLDKLRQYNKANLLLINCLKLAYVSDRALIERSLLLPPDRGVHF